MSAAVSAIIIAVLTTLSTVIVEYLRQSMKKQKVLSSSKAGDSDSDLSYSFTSSNRVDSNYKVADDMDGSIVFKTRRLDNVRSPARFMVKEVLLDSIILENDIYMIKLLNLYPCVVQGIVVNIGEKLGAVMAKDNSEGRLIVKIDKMERENVPSMSNDQHNM